MGEDPVDPETREGPGVLDDDDDARVGERAARVERLRALAEVERLDAEPARRARTRRPRTRWTPSATSSPRPRRREVWSGGGSRDRPARRRDDVNAAAVAAAAALTGAALRDDSPPPAPGSARAAVAQLAAALVETRNALSKAKRDLSESKRSARARGDEKAAREEAEASQRAVVRELTARVSALGRDKGELAIERDALRERVRGLRHSLSRYPDPPPVAERAASSSDAATQAGASHPALGTLVDAHRLGDLLRRNVEGLERAAEFISDRAKSDSSPEFARAANALRTETAAIASALGALVAEESARLSSAELVSAAATAATRAMPSAPLVHTVVPSVVAPAVPHARVVAVSAFDGIDGSSNAPMARVAASDVATDVDGLAAPSADAAVDAVARVDSKRSAPTARTTGAPARGRRHEPGVRAQARHARRGRRRRNEGRRRSRRVVRRRRRDAVRDARGGDGFGALVADAGAMTEPSDDEKRNAEALEALRARETASERREAELGEKVEKWKERCASLRAELARAMELAADAAAEAGTLRGRVRSARGGKGNGEGEGKGGAGASKKTPQEETGRRRACSRPPARGWRRRRRLARRRRRRSRRASRRRRRRLGASATSSRRATPSTRGSSLRSARRSGA